MKPFIFLIALLPIAAGCGISPIDKVSNAEKVFTKANLVFASNVREGFITDREQIKATQQLIHDIDAALDIAKALAATKQNAEFNRMWPEVESDLDRLLVDVGRNAKPPTTRETSWRSSRSSHYFASSWQSERDWPTPWIRHRTAPS